VHNKEDIEFFKKNPRFKEKGEKPKVEPRKSADKELEEWLKGTKLSEAKIKKLVKAYEDKELFLQQLKFGEKPKELTEKELKLLLKKIEKEGE
ncbi:hypothetical protein D6783_03880, partial [Candidatus Woesearchaeota archaeon]